jgi:hypothetical protein
MAGRTRLGAGRRCAASLSLLLVSPAPNRSLRPASAPTPVLFLAASDRGAAGSAGRPTRTRARTTASQWSFTPSSSSPPAPPLAPLAPLPPPGAGAPALAFAAAPEWGGLLAAAAQALGAAQRLHYAAFLAAQNADPLGLAGLAATRRTCSWTRPCLTLGLRRPSHLLRTSLALACALLSLASDTAAAQAILCAPFHPAPFYPLPYLSAVWV